MKKLRESKPSPCQGTTPSPHPPPSPLPIPLQTPVPIPEVHPLVPNPAPPLHLFCNSEVRTASEAKQATWYAGSRYRGVKARIAGEYQAMALTAVKGVYSTGVRGQPLLRFQFRFRSELRSELQFLFRRFTFQFRTPLRFHTSSAIPTSELLRK
jgi:hypothetical protein